MQWERQVLRLSGGRGWSEVERVALVARAGRATQHPTRQTKTPEPRMGSALAAIRRHSSVSPLASRNRPIAPPQRQGTMGRWSPGSPARAFHASRAEGELRWRERVSARRRGGDLSPGEEGGERSRRRACAAGAHLVRGGDEALVLREHQDDDEDHVDLTCPQLLGGADGTQQRDEQGVRVGA